MSDLNMTISAEEQESVEAKLVEINGGQIFLGFSSIASSLVSELVVAQAKPASLEESLAILEIYANCVKKIFGVDPVIMDAEKIKAYHNFQSIITHAEEQVKAQQEAMRNQEAQAQEDIIDAPPTEAAVSDIDKVVDMVEKATDVVKSVTADNVTPIPKKNSGRKPPKKGTTTTKKS